MSIKQVKLPLELVKLANQAGDANMHICNGDDSLGGTERNRTTERLNQNVEYWQKRFDEINEKMIPIMLSLGLTGEYNGLYPTFYNKEHRIIDY